jgi:hypothetical protein
LPSFKSRIIGIGIFLGAAAAIAIVVSPSHHHFLNPGPMTPGHEKMSCVSCHSVSQGTSRQQIQANAAYLLGLREKPVAFGFEVPTSNGCAACHQRPDDPYPVHRFAEPGFADALKTVDATTCMGCHREHQGARVSSGGEFCSACHADLDLKGDPLDVSHRALISQERWTTCLGCHDYHANHARKAQQRLADAYAADAVKSYLATGPDPYAGIKRHLARESQP